MSKDWYARPVLFVADVDRTLDFYEKQLGFIRSWRHEEAGKALVAEANREGCTLIFSAQWPNKVGKGLMFLSLPGDKAELTQKLDQLRLEFESKGVAVEDGWWGYKVLVVRDPDGNELYFAYPND